MLYKIKFFEIDLSVSYILLNTDKKIDFSVQ